MRWLAVLPVLFAGCASASGDTRAEADETPLVIELFTSQGCSSCPPAEALLNKFAHDGKVGGRAVIPLAFHVDYWDDLGWADPFALPAWSERQRQYASALGDSVYTPELVVGGRVGMVGSDFTRVTKAVVTAPAQHSLTAHATWTTTSITIDASAPADADVLVAIYQNGTSTKVPRGENAGTTMPADRVVRRLERVAAAGKTGSLTLPLDARWGTVGAVAFAQRTDKAIVAAALLSR